MPLQQQQPLSQSFDIGQDFNFIEGNNVFSPRDLVQLPRPGNGIINPGNDLAIVPVSVFEGSENQKLLSITSLNSSISPIQLHLAKGGEAFWLDERTVGYVVSEKDQAPQLFAYSVDYSTESLSAPHPPVLVGSFPEASVSNFVYSSSSNLLVFSADVYPDGDLHTVKEHDEAWENRGSSALVYEDTYVRHWDTYKLPKDSALFSVELKKSDDGKSWILSDTYYSPLKDTGHHSPVAPFGGTDDFDTSDTHIVYTAKDPALSPGFHTRQNVYIVPLKGDEKPIELTTGTQGATHGPIFSKQGDKVAWLELKKDTAEADRARIVIYDLEKKTRFYVAEKWDLSPSSIIFSPDGKHLYLTVGERARVKIFALRVPATPKKSTSHISIDAHPIPLTHSHNVADIQTAGEGSILFTQNSFTSPNNLFLLSGLDDPQLFETAGKHVKVTRVTRFGELELSGKELDPGHEFWFKGSEDKHVQGWILKPPGYKEEDKKKWPVALLVHGGPQSAWEDSWSTRWNPNIFAQQGYFVIAINPTGSTTFGQDFTDAISEHWGSRPFVDLRKGYKHVLDHYPQIDPERAVAAGASWGGYAMNWIQSHPEWKEFNFKALFCHDGVFDTLYNGFATDEIFFFQQEFGGQAYSKKGYETAERFNPARLTDKWKTPMLIVHGGKDYRLPDTEGISAFHAMKVRGVPARLVLFPDENHWVLNHKNSLKWHWEVFRWFNIYVGKK